MSVSYHRLHVRQQYLATFFVRMYSTDMSWHCILVLHEEINFDNDSPTKLTKRNITIDLSKKLTPAET
jgi:hypothetical protein